MKAKPAGGPEKPGNINGRPLRSLVIPVMITMLAMLTGMSIYQIAKYLLLPGLSLIKSNIVTVFFSTTVATVAAYFILRKRQALFRQLLREIEDRKLAEEEIKTLNEDLEYHIAQLEAANSELESFSYSVSHDLRAPLRHIIGYIELLQKNASSSLDEKSLRYLSTVSGSAKRMGMLIDDLLTFSRIGRVEIQKSSFNAGQIVHEVLAELRPDTNGREIAWDIGPMPDIYGDRSLMRLVFLNLISNAIKFTSPQTSAAIEIGTLSCKENEAAFFIRDNGVGFNMKYVNKLFGVFQRLHSANEFEGTGIGLANVQRVILRHGGKTWAEGSVGQGATFYFSIPKKR